MSDIPVRFRRIPRTRQLAADATRHVAQLRSRWKDVVRCAVTFEQPAVSAASATAYIARVHISLANGYELFAQEFAESVLGLGEATRNAFQRSERRVRELSAEGSLERAFSL